ncbi:MAG: acetamidase, partial [SAR202 cluster bacterium]|nr:acetamidase [SAR202 cluster bacterium]
MEGSGMKSIRPDLSKTCAEEPSKGHNRWHPDIPPAVEIAPGEELELDTRDTMDGQITPRSKSSDLKGLQTGRVHPLTGPVHVRGAEPGDLLEVELREMRPGSFGFTTIAPGFGLLRDLFDGHFLAKWTIKDGCAISAELPGVRIPDGSFFGVMGVAPSRLLRQEILLREEGLRRRGGMVLPPDPVGAVP